MRLGVSTDWETKDAETWAEYNKKMGMQTVVFPLNADESDERINEYLDAAKKAQLSVAEVGIWRNAIDSDKMSERNNLDYSIRQLALADRIGARCCVNVAGAFSGNRWDGPHKDNFSEDAWKKTVKMIQTVIDEVNPVNTFFTIEPMPWMIPGSPEEYLRLIEDVARDRFAVHLDAINMISCPERYFFAEEFLENTFNLLKGKIRSCHLKDVILLPEYTFQLRECGPGEGAFPIQKYLHLINCEDPEMPVIIEHLHSNEEYCRSVRYVREHFDNCT